MPGAPPDVIDRTERWFVSRGIPHFIDRYSAAHDIFTRAVPVLGAVVVIEVAGALDVDWPWWANGLAVVGGLAILLGGFALQNVLRGRRPLARPVSVGAADLAVFVLLPAFLPVIFGGQVGAAVATAAGNLLLLGVIYVFTSYGVVPMVRWSAGRLASQLGSVAGLLVRALPLLLLFVTFLFVNAEVWQVSATLSGPFLAATVLLFVAVGTVFLVSRIPREVSGLVAFATWDAAAELLAGTPVDGIAVDGRPPEDVVPPLTRRQWGNVGLVMLVAQGVQVVVVSATLGLFFVVFGLLTVTPETIASWTGAGPHELATAALWGRDVVVSRELLQVAGFLAAFSGLYFAVYVVTDATYRQEFFDEVLVEVRQAFAVRAVYLAVREEVASPR